MDGKTQPVSRDRLLKHDANDEEQRQEGARENGHESCGSDVPHDGAGRDALLDGGSTKRVKDPDIRLLLEAFGAGLALFYAASHLGIDAVEQLLLDSSKADANATDIFGCTPLHAACSRGLDSVATLLLNHGADRNAHDKNGWTPLYVACEMGHYGPIALLLKGNACDPNARTRIGRTTLHEACVLGNDEIIAALLSSGADPNDRDNEGLTPIFMAIEYGHHNAVSMLLQAGANPIEASFDGRTPLHAACKYGRYSIVECLLSIGVDRNSVEYDGGTPLHVACRYGHDQLVELLLSTRILRNGLICKIDKGSHHGADPTVTENSFATPACDPTISPGANPNVQDVRGRTPLHAATEKESEAAALSLLEHGADLNIAETIHGMTPLHLACQMGHDYVIELLVEYGGNPNAKDHNDSTPFHAASKVGDKIIISVLLECGADVNLADKDGLTPLYIASCRGHDIVVDLLLERGANPNAATKRDGWTPLHVACQNGHKYIVHRLLANQADPSARDALGNTPHNLAAYSAALLSKDEFLSEEVSFPANSNSNCSSLWQKQGAIRKFTCFRCLTESVETKGFLCRNKHFYCYEPDCLKVRRRANQDWMNLICFREGCHAPPDSRYIKLIFEARHNLAPETNDSSKLSDSAPQSDPIEHGNKKCMVAGFTAVRITKSKANKEEVRNQMLQDCVIDRKESERELIHFDPKNELMIRDVMENHFSATEDSLLPPTEELKCPRFCLMWPMHDGSIGPDRLLVNKCQIYFLCSHDLSPVKTPFTIQDPKTWVKTASKFLQLSVFAVRLLTLDHGLVPLPQLPSTIPGNTSREQLVAAVMYMQSLLDRELVFEIETWLQRCHDTPELLESAFSSMTNGLPEQALTAVSMEACTSSSCSEWMKEMELVSMNDDLYAWVKIENVEDWKEAVLAKMA